MTDNRIQPYNPSRAVQTRPVVPRIVLIDDQRELATSPTSQPAQSQPAQPRYLESLPDSNIQEAEFWDASKQPAQNGIQTVEHVVRVVHEQAPAQIDDQAAWKRKLIEDNAERAHLERMAAIQNGWWPGSWTLELILFCFICGFLLFVAVLFAIASAF
jgi:hypothetical protein